MTMADKNYQKESAEDMDIDIPVSDEDADALQKEIDDLTAKLEESEKKIGEADDKYLRLCAEYDNYRKRTSKEKLEIFSDSTIKCIAEILPVLDNFERAIESECSDESFKNGMQMIYNQFSDSLKKIGVTEMEAMGAEFDPNLHNAIKQMEDENFGENTVCEVFQKGYMYNDKVIRHAVVAVAN
jgi:molecular chaperone GrpE